MWHLLLTVLLCLLLLPVAGCQGITDLDGTPPHPATRTQPLVALAAGDGHTCAAAADGSAYCWGDNASGQLGIGSRKSTLVPVQVASDVRFVALSAGGSLPPPEYSVPLAPFQGHTCGLTTEGQAYCWGNDSAGQLGLGMPYSVHGPVPSQDRPVAVLGEQRFSSIHAGFYRTCGLAPAGRIYCWGHDPAAVAGSRPDTLASSGGRAFRALAARDRHGCALDESGTAHCWGSNRFAQLGERADSVGHVRHELAPVPGGLTFTALSAGVSHNCALTSEGRAYCWGRNDFGQLGIGATTPLCFAFLNSYACEGSTFAPQPVAADLVFRELTGGQVHTCALTPEGEAYCWGRGTEGQLGDGTGTDSAVPVAVAGDLRFATLAAGHRHSCGITTEGSAYCWGWGQYGQLGTGTTANALSPVRVAGQP